MKVLKLILFFSFIFSVPVSIAYEYQWINNEEIEGADSVTEVKPLQVIFLDEPIEVVTHSASLRLMQKYSVYLGTEWSPGNAYRLLKTFESIPQLTNNPYHVEPTVPYSLWKLTRKHIQGDIEIDVRNRQTIVTVSEGAFTYTEPRLAEIEGVEGRYFSKRLHHAVVRFVTDDGRDRQAIEYILNKRYGISLNVPDYTELTRHTTGEHAARFTTFKDEEVLDLVNMIEEFPTGMHKITGLNYIIRRLDGTPHPLYPTAPAVAWTQSGYIEFMESAFLEQGADYIHRLILHEKAHFLWEYLFDDQLKQDWIELGGWYENPDDVDGWSTTKQLEFVSAYAHGKNPNEDMAESISHYIVRPDILRSRAPDKYQFIQDRIMHGTRYISRIREDLTFQVYNLYPDVVYPGRIIRVNIDVSGEPEADKRIVIEIELHQTGDLDTAQASSVRIFSDKGTYFDIWLYPIKNGIYTDTGHILRGEVVLSRYAAHGYWGPDAITLKDAQGNERHQSQTDFGWKLYINSPLADTEAPIYVKNSMRLSLSDDMENGRPLQILTAQWKIIEQNDIESISARANDESDETYSRHSFNFGTYDKQTGLATVKLIIPDYFQTGIYSLNHISMKDIALNTRGVYFTKPHSSIRDEEEILDEKPATIHIKTTNPDSNPPILDLNWITVTAEPTNPDEPNGETRVDITFRIKDDISGYSKTYIDLRDPHGVVHTFSHLHSDYYKTYFTEDPFDFKIYNKTIILPVGSVPGTWGISQMTVQDKAQNILRADFTEIVRFVVNDMSVISQYDVNGDGKIDILDLIMVANAFGTTENDSADVNGDGAVNIQDLVGVASHIGEGSLEAPTTHNLTANQIQSWITQATQVDDGSPAFQSGIRVLQDLLLELQPEKTELLPNYPNPFNPETWIPYKLANPSDIIINIYDSSGSLVRQLDLGHQSTGIYQIRSRAAYWDGRNKLGERVANGIYFYQLQTDSVSPPLRKMVILK
ncbi:hypothetical protein C6497_11715 [Candidatus Poribacteria bacterium]|nr:MAG: hypothetical protein C6497_11715 [Candidatus Poribacteria bacterium]